MNRMSRLNGAGWLVACATIVMSAVIAGRAFDAPQVKTQIKGFEILGVNGNKVLIRDSEGARELTVPKDFRVDVDGKMVGVSDLKPGMRGDAVITTTTTVKKMFTSEVKQGRITKVVGRNVILMIAGETDYKMLTQEDGQYVFRNGKPIDWETLRVGDVLTATIVSEKATVFTDKDVKVTATAPGAGSAGASAAGSGSAGSPASGPAAASAGSAGSGATGSSAPAGTPATSSAASPSASAATGTAPAAPAEAGGMSPLMIGGIVAALALIGVILLGMRRKDEERR